MNVLICAKNALRSLLFWRALVTWGIAVAILIAGWSYGIKLQRAVWEETDPIRFVADIKNAFNQGRRADAAGLTEMYDEVASNSSTRYDGVQDYGLDYPPVRLTVATTWYRWTAKWFPDQYGWQNSYEFNAPLLMMNRGFLALAAASTFGLVHMARRWRYAGLLNRPADAHVGAIAGAMAALLVWFSPPALLVGFGWPQWDICVPAFFLAALYAGCRDAWLSAGLLLVTGGMFKGQVFVALPVMLIWPIVAGRWGGAARFIIGLLLGAAVITAPFSMPGRQEMVRPEVIWFALSMFVPWGLAMARRLMPRVRNVWWIVPCLISVYVCAVAGLIAAWHVGAIVGGCLAIFIFLVGQKLRWRYQAALPALGMASAFWLSAVFTGASWNWLHVGLLYGTDHFPKWNMGNPSNFAGLLPDFGVSQPTVVAMTLPDWVPRAGGCDVTWRVLLRSIFLVGCVLSGIAMGVHFRRRNALFLLAATSTWLAFVTFPAQIHERYILYPSLVSASLLALGFGWTFMHIAISLIAVLPVLDGMLGSGHPGSFLSEEMGWGFGSDLLENVRATHPGIGWALTVIALVCLWKSMDLRRPRPAALPACSAAKSPQPLRVESV